jgi:preprotein translocase subunit SecG
MTTVLIIIHVMVAVVLIGVILIQRGQGADMGASFGGGGAQTLFGSRGSGSFLGKLTGGLAAAFMLTSLSLAFFSQQQTGSVVERTTANSAPAIPADSERQPAGGGFDPSRLADTPADDLPPAN